MKEALYASNEMRQVVGLLPVDDPKANELSNKNLNSQAEQQFPNVAEQTNTQ